MIQIWYERDKTNNRYIREQQYWDKQHLRNKFETQESKIYSNDNGFRELVEYSYEYSDKKKSMEMCTQIKYELLEVTWHPDRFIEWCLDINCRAKFLD